MGTTVGATSRAGRYAVTNNHGRQHGGVSTAMERGHYAVTNTDHGSIMDRTKVDIDTNSLVCMSKASSKPRAGAKGVGGEGKLGCPRVAANMRPEGN